MPPLPRRVFFFFLSSSSSYLICLSSSSLLLLSLHNLAGSNFVVGRFRDWSNQADTYNWNWWGMDWVWEDDGTIIKWAKFILNYSGIFGTFFSIGSYLRKDKSTWLINIEEQCSECQNLSINLWWCLTHMPTLFPPFPFLYPSQRMPIRLAESHASRSSSTACAPPLCACASSSAE